MVVGAASGCNLEKRGASTSLQNCPRLAPSKTTNANGANFPWSGTLRPAVIMILL